MIATDFGQAEPVVVALSTPCWWIDRGDCWEITHHATQEDAEADHADRVRSDYGWPLSVAGAFAIVPGVARQEQRRCYEATCPECGAQNHIQHRYESCVDECGYEFEITQIAFNDPHQIELFEAASMQDAGDPTVVTELVAVRDV